MLQLNACDAGGYAPFGLADANAIGEACLDDDFVGLLTTFS